MVKYRNADGRIILKVTDNTTVVQFKTDQQTDLRKIERLNTRFFALMTRGVSEETDAFLAQQAAEAQASSGAAGDASAVAGGKRGGGRGRNRAQRV